MAKLSHKLEEWRKKIEDCAFEYGIRPCPVEFEILPYQDMQEIVAYTGFPSRYPHWTFGQEFFNHSMYDKYGLTRIYEIIANTSPARAFLLEGNSDTVQKLVIAHCYGHADFFTNNIWFADTNKKMLDTAANHGTTIQKLVERHGQEKVEKFLDKCLSLDNLIANSNICFPPETSYKPLELDQPRQVIDVPKIQNIDLYMDAYVNPKEWITQQRERKIRQQKKSFPETPDKDVVNFLLTYSTKLKPWQRTILSIIREESYYFLPQRMTKISNEGWATFVHNHLMINYILLPSEITEYAKLQAGVLAAGRNLNPYRIGFYLYTHIADRWNKGKFGPEYENCEDDEEKLRWDKKVNGGKEKIFEVRQFCNDTNFINSYLDEEFCREQDLYVSKNGKEDEKSKDYVRIKTVFVNALTNTGSPIIQVEDANYKDGGLLLGHVFIGRELDKVRTAQVLKTVFSMWGKPIHLKTVRILNDGRLRNILWSCDSESEECEIHEIL